MFFGKVFSAAVLGFTALAGVATASVVPAPVFDVKPRAEAVNTTQAVLDTVTKFQTNVYEILPKLVDYDRAGLDTSPVFDALLQTYDETIEVISSLPPVKATSDVPNETEQKIIDVSNETLNSVNAVVNILNKTDVNAKYARAVADRGDKAVNALVIGIGIAIGRIRIIIIIYW
ncbi:hypothetical protein FRC03_001014 [Tulasnella sp. 419]|nr:hypothetical protein FRC03_001014 [Tulasnella sp. 419]